MVQAGDVQRAINSIRGNSTGLGSNNASSADAAAWLNDTYAQVLGLADLAQDSIVSLVPTNTDDFFANEEQSNPTLWRIAGIVTLIVSVLFLPHLHVLYGRTLQVLSYISRYVLRLVLLVLTGALLHLHVLRAQADTHRGSSG